MSTMFPNPFMLSTLDGINGFAINGKNASIYTSDHSGWSVAGGDINGDGIDDVIIGARDASPGDRFFAGATYVVFGKQMPWNAEIDLFNLNGINGFVINGANSYDGSGRSVAFAGDINGDGISDLIIGASDASPSGRASAGVCYVVFGHQMPWNSTFELSTINGVNGFVINGALANDYTGKSVAAAGDINGDGIADLLIGAPGVKKGSDIFVGATYIVFGHGMPWNSSLELATIDGLKGSVIYGILANDLSGSSIASAGDVNNDGITDVVIGAFGAAPGGVRGGAGITYVVFGHLMPWNVSMELSSLNGINGFSINGVNNADNSGYSVASAGDVNADNISDLIIGAWHANPPSRSGACYVILGHQMPWNATLELSSLSGMNGFVINGISGNDNTGWSVAFAGDVNNDGISDLIIGTNGAAPGGRQNAGVSYVVFGHPMPWGPSLELSSLNSFNGFSLHGVTAEDYSGYSVSNAGDINNDGIGDLIVGAHNASPAGRMKAGISYLIFGKNVTHDSSSTGISSTLHSSTGQSTGASSVTASSSTSGSTSTGGSSTISSTGISSTADSTGTGNTKSSSSSMSSTATTGTASITGTSSGHISSSASGSSGSSGTEVSGATRNKPWIVEILKGAFSLVGSFSSYGKELLSNINPFSTGNAVGKFSSDFSSVSSKIPALLAPTEEEYSAHTGNSTENESIDRKGFKMPIMSLNDYLVVIPYVTHYIRKYSPFTLPWNKTCQLSNTDIKILEEQQITLKRHKETRRNQRISRAECSGMFNDQSQFIDMQLEWLTKKIAELLSSKKANVTQLNEITNRLERVNETIHVLAKLNKSLKRLDIKVNREVRRRPQNQVQLVAKVQHDPVSGILTQRLIAVNSAEGIGLIFNSTKSRQSLLFSSKSVDFISQKLIEPQQIPNSQNIISESLMNRKAMRR